MVFVAVSSVPTTSIQVSEREKGVEAITPKEANCFSYANTNRKTDAEKAETGIKANSEAKETDRNTDTASKNRDVNYLRMKDRKKRFKLPRKINLEEQL